MNPSDRPQGSRPFDVVLFGATGFAGRLTAEYLQQTHPNTRWAIAGRSRDRLEAVAADLARLVPDAPSVPVLVADSGDRASLDAMAAQTRVVCTTVGPYAKYGAELVAACVEAGTHACDLTGEPQFVHRMIAQHHERAQVTGARIVHAAGFDSIPSDLGVLVLQEEAIARAGVPCDEVEFVLLRSRGGFSGGTLASMLNLLDEGRDSEVRRVLADPYSLCPEGGPDGREQLGVRWSPSAEAWTGPFVMAATNERIVRRSNALLGHRYGRDFRYHEVMRTGTGMGGMARGVALSAGVALGVGALAVRPLRRLAMRYLPNPGEGPSREAIARGFFDIRLVGWRSGQRVLSVDVHGTRDPGYGATACMLGETAIALSTEASLGAPGVTTPAAALGMSLVRRLNQQLVTFSVAEG